MGESSPTVAPANREQLRAWDGDEGAYWAARSEHFDRSVSAHHAALMAAAAIGVRDRVLDIGCGTGQVALEAARLATEGNVLGVDLSSAMLDHARRQAADEGLGNVAFEQADAQVHPFEAESFDVALGRMSAMFFGDKVAAFGNIGRALRPGGRLVITTWQPLAANEWLGSFVAAMSTSQPTGAAAAPPPRADVPGPFSLSEPDRIVEILTAAGYRDIVVDATAAPMWFGRDADDAFDFVSGLLAWMVAGLDQAARRRSLAALRSTIEAHETADGVLYASATWTTTAVRARSAVSR